jgi:hypothetical protein
MVAMLLGAARERSAAGSIRAAPQGSQPPAPSGLTVRATPRTLTPFAGEFGQMARKKVSTTIYITPDQDEKLKLLNERTKVPVAVYIREGIDMVLAKHEHHLPGQLTLDAPAPAKKRS